VALVVTHEPANWLAEGRPALQLAPGGAWRVRPPRAGRAGDGAEEDSLAATR
jgi:hypothetical protein